MQNTFIEIQNLIFNFLSQIIGFIFNIEPYDGYNYFGIYLSILLFSIFIWFIHRTVNSKINYDLGKRWRKGSKKGTD